MIDTELNHRLALARRDTVNSLTADDTGYECPVCGNKGFVADLHDDGSIYADGLVMRPCNCVKVRKGIAHLKKMGLLEAVRGSNIKDFRTEQPHQKKMKQTVQDFLKNTGGAWLYMGGQPGCGKTMLCNYVYGRLLNAGYDCWYMSWTEESKTLRRYANNPEAFERHAYPLTHAEVLYIDDLMKGTMPTAAEKALAFEIINARYRANRITIISSEWLLDNLIDLDEATGSRILEKAGEFVVNVLPDRAKNYRTKKTASSAANTGDGTKNEYTYGTSAPIVAGEKGDCQDGK